MRMVARTETCKERGVCQRRRRKGTTSFLSEYGRVEEGKEEGGRKKRGGGGGRGLEGGGGKSRVDVKTNVMGGEVV